MSPNQSPQNLMPQPLGIGNTVNLGIYLYRIHFKLYLRLTLTAHLWLLVPIYGWAKFCAISALISRLAFNTVRGHPETVKAAQSHLKRRLWSFLITGILVPIISLSKMLIVWIVFVFVLGVVFALLESTLGLSLQLEQVADKIYGNLIFFVIGVFFYASPLWFYSRLFVTDLPLATEKTMNLFNSIKRSREITKKCRQYVIGIILVSFLIVLPIIMISYLLLILVNGMIYGFLSRIVNTVDFDSIILFVIGFWLLLISVTTMPLWQTIKAITYYNLLCRREGFDLKLGLRKV